MSDPYIGEIKYCAFNFAQYSYAFCNGALLDINQFSALYSLLGTQFGNTTTSNFRLPNLCGRAVVGPGIAPNGTGMTDWVQADVAGAETVTVSSSQYPNHTHVLSQLTQTPTTGTPLNTMNFTQFTPPSLCGLSATGANTTLHPAAIGLAGVASTASHENRQPFLALNPCIALYGVYPEFP